MPVGMTVVWASTYSTSEGTNPLTHKHPTTALKRYASNLHLFRLGVSFQNCTLHDRRFMFDDTIIFQISSRRLYTFEHHPHQKLTRAQCGSENSLSQYLPMLKTCMIGWMLFLYLETDFSNSNFCFIVGHSTPSPFSHALWVCWEVE